MDKVSPEVLYFDWWICQPVFQLYLKTFAAYYYNRGVEWKKPVAINFKEWEGISFPRGAGVFDMERGAASDIQPALWQTCTSVRAIGRATSPTTSTKRTPARSWMNS